MSGWSRRALVSVSDKTGLVPFVQGLIELGFEILSTGGTRKHLEAAGLKILDVAAYTGFPEMMDGRVKTLHPKVHGGLLGRPGKPEDRDAMTAHGIHPIELVVVNLYPFEATIARPDVSLDEAIENIDIGGPSMVRSAAKNHEYVAIVTAASQYDEVLAALKTGPLSTECRRALAGAAFEMTARYDRAVADYFARLTSGDCAPSAAQQTSASPTSAQPSSNSDQPAWPEQLSLSLRCRDRLRYGENPHQSGAWYVEPNYGPATLSAAEKLHGKELSYNNLLDLDAALNLVREFSEPAAVVLKHNNPCGAAIGETISAAWELAYQGDPVSAFGSILGFNRELDLATAEQLCLPDRFVEAIIAPAYSPAAFELLTTKPKWKANVRLLRCAGMNELRPTGWDYRRVTGGMLLQSADDQPEHEADWKVVTTREPTTAEWKELRFAWKLVKHVKSNAIVLTNQGQLVGAGAGQMSRVDSVNIAAQKAAGRAVGGAVASDAFFPFRDGLDLAAKAGVKAVIQPGGSRNDGEVIAACNEQGLTMVFTGRRHFRH